MSGHQRDDVIALLPAAGFGSRMGGEVPKQYLTLNQRSVLECTLERIRAVPGVTRMVLAVSQAELDQKRHFPADVSITAGGSTRAQSVRNGLAYIADGLGHSGLVLVHDAARPCVRVSDINRLLSEAGASEHGGILAIPVHDTLKRTTQNNRITATVDRSHMWRAVTPQLFNVGTLIKALDHAMHNALEITDEASAMESAGYQPHIVACAQDNIKITVPEDLALAQVILAAQQSAHAAKT